MKLLEQTEALEHVRDYLLGRLNELKEQRYHERLLSDAEYLQTVEEAHEVVLDELVDDYLSRELSGDDRSAFEERLLRSPEIRARLELGRAFLVVRQRAEYRSSWEERFRLWMQSLLQSKPALAPVLAACLVLALGGGIWSTLRIGQLDSQLREATSQQTRLTGAQFSLQSQLDEERQVNTRLTQELEAARTSLLDPEPSRERVRIQGVFAVASFILKPGLQRGSGEIARVPISPDQMIVELKLDLGLDEYPSYRVVLYDSGGDEVLSQANLQATAARDEVYIIFQLPTQIFRVDDYQVTLSGVTASQRVQMIDHYYFRVSRL